MLRQATLAATLATVATLAPAQQEAAVELDEMVVTTTRSETAVRDAPRAISVVDAQRIQHATQQLSLDEALAGVPGLYLQNRYNFAQDLRIALRGFGARSSFGIRGIKLIVDGIPETLPDGQAGVDSIDLGSARRIEVLRGPASTLHGNAAGGVIAVTSELGSATPYVEARGAGGEHGYAQWQLKSAGTLGDTDYLFNLSQTRLDGYREHARARGALVNAKLGTALGEAGRLIVSFNHTDQPEAQDPGGIDAAQAAARPDSAFARNVQFDAGEELDQQRLGAVYRHEGRAGTLSLRLHVVTRDFANRLPFEAGGQVVLDRRFIGGGLQYALARLPQDLELMLGLDLDRQDDDRQRYDNLDGRRGPLVFDQNEAVDSLGGFVQARYAFPGDWTLQAGLRYDEVSYDLTDRHRDDGDDSGRLDFDAVSPSLSVSRALAHGVVFASYSSSFETPTTTELASPDESGGFNAALEPQAADSYELGIKYGQGSVFAEIALFAIELDDELVPFELDAFPGRTFYANAGRSSRRGVETALSWRPARGLQIDVSYTWSDFAFARFVDADGTDFGGRQLPGLPPHFGYLGLRYAPAQGLFATLEASHAGTLFADNANQVAVSSHTVVNFRLAQDIRAGSLRIRPYLGINNLLDEDYFSNVRINAFGGRHFEPAPGRSVYAGLSLGFGAHPRARDS